MGTKSQIYVVVGVVAAIMFVGGFYAFTLTQNTNDVNISENSNSASETITNNFVETAVEPYTFTVLASKFEIDVKESPIDPEISTVDDMTLTNDNFANTEFILPLIKNAFAIVPGANTVTLTEWLIPVVDASFRSLETDQLGRVYFLDGKYSKVSQLDTTTNSLRTWEVPTSSPNMLHTVAADSSGNLFITKNLDGEISKLDLTTNMISTWTMPSTDSYPGHVIVDSTGIVYFVLNGIDKGIARLDPSTNELKIWPITESVGLNGIVIDSTGNIFFPKSNNKISKLDPINNQFTDWYIPTLSSGPYDIDIDSFGNLYFPERTGNKIGKLDPTSNVFVEWEIPLENGKNPNSITVDSNDVVYFTNTFLSSTYSTLPENIISRLVPSTNTFSVWTLHDSPNSNPFSITVNSNGVIYFGSIGDSKIGSIS